MDSLVPIIVLAIVAAAVLMFVFGTLGGSDV